MTTKTSIAPPIPLKDIRRLERLLGRSLAGWRDKAPRWVSPSPAEVEGAWFDVKEVARVIRVLRKMPHTKPRQWAGKPFDPEPWQVIWIIAPVFGWKDADGFRIVRTVWDEMPRKNGKSTLSSRLALYLLTADGEEGPEVYAAATSTVQARQVFDEAKVVALRSVPLKRRCEPLASVIRVPQTFGVFRVLSRIAESVHGLNVSGAVIDEIHLHKKRDLIDAIETGTGAREQPLVFHITTAGDGDETTIYAEKHNQAIAVARGDIVRPSLWVCIWCADKEDDWRSEETWKRANPNYGISVRRQYLAEAFAEAEATPTVLSRVLRLHLGIRHGLEGERWPGADHWSEQGNVGLVPEDKLKGKRCWGGLVAATATDMTALNWTFTNPEGPGVWSIWRYFLPEDQLGELNRRTGGAAEVWAKNGLLELTEGNEISVDAHVERIKADCKTFDVRELAYDAGGAIGIVQPLMEAKLTTFVAIHANTPGGSLIDWERLVSAGEYNHGGNPVSAWEVSHLLVRETAGATWRIDRKGSPENVYGAVAAEIALRRWLLGASKSKARTGFA